MLHAVPDGGTAIAAQAQQLAGTGAGDDGIGFLCLAVLEYPGSLEHKCSGPAADSSDYPLEADERRRAVAAVHHQVFGLSFPLDIAGEGLRDAGPGKFWQVLALAIRLLIPVLDGKSSIRGLLH